MRVLVAILVALGVLAVSTYPAQAGGDGTIRIGSYAAQVGDEVTVALEAVDIPPPGLGTWTVNITYDTTVVSLLECNAQFGGVCNPAYSEDTIRVTGASAGGLTGTATLADIVFVCDRAGTTDLAMSLFFGGSFDVGEEPSFPDPVSGSILCTEPSDLITISSLGLEVGGEGKVRVEAERVVQPGVGAWMARHQL